ncbi:predicted protein [Histoplasma capsulatum H143]|uniref:Uncharacterized protein n=1 Tax=Ajellomyces capsulatus (strain H143) TaxID=544712 RepID=C6HEZ3_AJECH|nr:predicted protein [Histoplasma capsulatum H143]
MPRHNRRQAPGRSRHSGHGHDISPTQPTPSISPRSSRRNSRRSSRRNSRRSSRRGLESLSYRPYPTDGSPMPRMQIHHGQGERVDPPPDNMAGYPRQVDISPQVRRSIEQHQREDLRVPKPFEEPATASDIQNLIAAIGKLEKRDRAQFPSNRYSLDTKELEPLSSPTRVPGRLTKLLDSLAGLLVSNANHEVIATALCVDATAKKITIKISSNTTVTTATCKHAKWIWTALSDISSRYHELYPASSEEPTPTHKIKNKEVQNLVFNFRIRCLRFNFAKIQKRINGKFLLFKKLDLTEFDKDHPLQTFSKAIIALEEYFTRTQGAIYGKPDENNTEAWEAVEWSIPQVPRMREIHL